MSLPEPVESALFANRTGRLGGLLRRIAAARYKPRPGRSYPRRSFTPVSPWGRNGRNRGV